MSSVTKSRRPTAASTSTFEDQLHDLTLENFRATTMRQFMDVGAFNRRLGKLERLTKAKAAGKWSCFRRTLLQAAEIDASQTPEAEIAKIKIGRFWNTLLSQPMMAGETRNSYSGRMSQCALVMAAADGSMARMGRGGQLLSVSGLQGRHKEWHAVQTACIKTAPKGSSMAGMFGQAIGFVAAAAANLCFDRPSVMPDTDTMAEELVSAMVALYLESKPKRTGERDDLREDAAVRYANKAISLYRRGATRLKAGLPVLMRSGLSTRGVRSIPGWMELARAGGIAKPESATLPELLTAIAPSMAAQVSETLLIARQEHPEVSGVKVKATRLGEGDVHERDLWQSASWWVGLIGRYNARVRAGISRGKELPLATVTNFQLFMEGGVVVHAPVSAERDSTVTAAQRNLRATSRKVSAAPVTKGSWILRLLQDMAMHDEYQGRKKVVRGPYLGEGVLDELWNVATIFSRYNANGNLHQYFGSNVKANPNRDGVQRQYPDLMPAFDAFIESRDFINRVNGSATLAEKGNGKDISLFGVTAADIICRALPQIRRRLLDRWAELQAKPRTHHMREVDVWADHHFDKFDRDLTGYISLAFGLSVGLRPANHANTLIGRHLKLKWKSGRIMAASVEYWSEDQFAPARLKMRLGDDATKRRSVQRTLSPGIIDFDLLTLYIERCVVPSLVRLGRTSHKVDVTACTEQWDTLRNPAIPLFPRPLERRPAARTPYSIGQVSRASWSAWVGRELYTALQLCGVPSLPAWEDRSKDAVALFAGHYLRALLATYWYGVRKKSAYAATLLTDTVKMTEAKYTATEGRFADRQGTSTTTDTLTFYDWIMDYAAVRLGAAGEDTMKPQCTPATWAKFWDNYTLRQKSQDAKGTITYERWAGWLSEQKPGLSILENGR